jgi:hypothetical protein
VKRNDVLGNKSSLTLWSRYLEKIGRHVDAVRWRKCSRVVECFSIRGSAKWW